jgi:hypothetical protein
MHVSGPTSSVFCIYFIENLARCFHVQYCTISPEPRSISDVSRLTHIVRVVGIMTDQSRGMEVYSTNENDR